MSDEEFEEFRRIYEQELAGTSTNDIVVPNTNMMKVLGTITTDLKGFHMKVSGDDGRHLNEIASLHNNSKNLHASCITIYAI